MVALNDGLLKTSPDWFWGVVCVVLVLLGVAVFMLAGVGLYLVIGGRHCG